MTLLALVIIGAVLLLAALVVGPKVTHHEAVSTTWLVDPDGAGDRHLYEVCACGATRDMSGGQWSQPLCRQPQMTRKTLH